MASSLQRDNSPALGSLGNLPLVKTPDLGFEILAPQAARHSEAHGLLAGASGDADAICVDRYNWQHFDKSDWQFDPPVSTRSGGGSAFNAPFVNGLAVNISFAGAA